MVLIGILGDFIWNTVNVVREISSKKITCFIGICCITCFTIEGLELAKESVVLPVLSTGFAFLGFLVVFVEVLELFPAFFPTPLVTVLFGHYSAYGD